jgi:CspA family cold shock protein
MFIGIVRWFDNSLGYGFIRDEGGNDVFVHFSVILAAGYRSLTEGQEVHYDAARGPKGTRAISVIPEPVTAAAGFFRPDP